MISKEEKNKYRNTLFKHLDGIAVAPVIYSLKEKGVLNYILDQKEVTLAHLVSKFQANEGYLNVGLRVLASQGWLQYNVNNSKDTVTFTVNKDSNIALNNACLYEDVVNFLKTSENFHPRKLEINQFLILNNILNKFINNAYTTTTKDNDEIRILNQIKTHIEGVIVGPLTVFLAMDGMFHKYFMEASFTADEFHENPEIFSKILDFFVFLGWFSKTNSHYKFTNKGLFFARRATAYGVTVSYIPTFRHVDSLMFGNPKILKSDLHASEIHVDREMNVWGSGGAHTAYFKKIDQIIMHLFNKPIAEQPKGILDMGCGNGAFLIHLFEVIEQRTLRGQMLEEYPLFLVGVDYNKIALKATRSNLIKADIWAKVIWGDITNPKALQQALLNDYNIKLSDLLNVRTFLDHNRPWIAPKNKNPKNNSKSTGAFAHQGIRLNNNLVEENLKEHFNNWKPFIEKYGLLLIELHTINPNLAADNLGKTAVTAYDATHGFSDQYILELDVFLKVLNEVGLQTIPEHFLKYPNNELATVSINYIKGKVFS